MTQLHPSDDLDLRQAIQHHGWLMPSEDLKQRIMADFKPYPSAAVPLWRLRGGAGEHMVRLMSSLALVGFLAGSALGVLVPHMDKPSSAVAEAALTYKGAGSVMMSAFYPSEGDEQ